MKSTPYSIYACPSCGSELLDARAGLTCSVHGTFPNDGTIIDFLPSHTDSFDTHWSAASSSQRARAKESIAEHFLRPVEAVDGERIRLLDVGCGDGVHIRLLAAKYHQVQLYGLDASMTALISASAVEGDWQAVHADAQFLPFRDECFDVAISFGVIAYLDEPARGIAEMARAVKRGGIIGIWIAPPRKGLGGFMLNLTRAIVSRVPHLLQRRLADLIVPILGLLPTVSGLDLRTGTWSECREVILINIAPPKLSFPDKREVEEWLQTAGCELVSRADAIPGEYWARKL